MRIAILEDDATLADQLSGTLAAAGHTPACFDHGGALLDRLRSESFDLMILDWDLPDMPGTAVLEWARSHLPGPPPMLFVSSRSDERDILGALTNGADDYLVKPVSPVDMLQRVNALLRATPADAGPAERFGSYRFDRARAEVTIGDVPVVLGTDEFDLALLLFRNRDRAVSRARMIEAIRPRDPADPRAIDLAVARVRDRLRLRPAFGYRLVPVYSHGYRLETVGDATGELK